MRLTRQPKRRCRYIKSDVRRRSQKRKLVTVTASKLNDTLNSVFRDKVIEYGRLEIREAAVRSLP